MFGSLECNIYLCTRNQEMIATISRSGAVVARWAHNPKVVSSSLASATKKKVSEKDAFFFCYAARLLSIFIFKTSLVFSIVSLREVILQK